MERRRSVWITALCLTSLVSPSGDAADRNERSPAPTEAAIAETPQPSARSEVARDVLRRVREGREVFRFDTFGDEQFWGETLRLHEGVAAVDPATALAVGLKVDSEALPEDVIAAILDGTFDLTSPDNTLELLRLNAVVGVTGRFDGDGALDSIGIQCALCHSTVDDTVTAGIGRRLDGWANRDLDVGTIVSLSPDLTPIAETLGVDEATVRTVLASWGPGRYDASIFLDGIGFRPDGTTAATLIPPAFGLAGVNLHTFTGWGGVSHWNAFVANIEMGGQGTFYDPRLDDPKRFPVAAANGLGDVRSEVDRITAKLPALQLYQLALEPPTPPEGSFDVAAAARGEGLFAGKADCARCHVPPLFTEPGWNAHTADEIGLDDFQAQRAPDAVYRTTPLRGLWTHTRGGFYHDGRFPTLDAVLDHYDATFSLGLTEQEKADLAQYLLSL